MRAIALALAVLSLPSVALADEVWTTSAGDVVYEADEGDTAILSYPVGESTKGYLYFPGLAGNFDERGVHYGYWIAETPGTCPTSMTGMNDVTSSSWGRATLIFHETAFPTGWTLLTGNCFEEPGSAIIGEPVTAE